MSKLIFVIHSNKHTFLDKKNNNNMENEKNAKKITSDDVFKTIGEFGK